MKNILSILNFLWKFLIGVIEPWCRSVKRIIIPNLCGVLVEGEMFKKTEHTVPPEYINAVTKLADERKSRRFLNDSDAQAQLIFWLMIRSLRPLDEVLIYSSALGHPFYSRVLSGACFVNSKAVLKILLDKKEGMEVIKKLPKDVRSRIDCRLAVKYGGAHLIVTPVAFRVEPTEVNNNELFVVINFYEPDVIEKLHERFNRIWENAVPLPID